MPVEIKRATHAHCKGSLVIRGDFDRALRHVVVLVHCRKDGGQQSLAFALESSTLDNEGVVAVLKETPIDSGVHPYAFPVKIGKSSDFVEESGPNGRRYPLLLLTTKDGAGEEYPAQVVAIIPLVPR